MAIIHLDPPPDPPPPKRRVWVALLLSFVTPGLVHLYAGSVKRAAFFFVVWLSVYGSAFLVAAADLLLPPWRAPWNLLPFSMLAAAGVAWVVIVLIDTARTIRALERFELQWFNRWYAYWAASSASPAASAVTRFVSPYTSAAAGCCVAVERLGKRRHAPQSPPGLATT